jgi:hypothetical protein
MPWWLPIYRRDSFASSLGVSAPHLQLESSLDEFESTGRVAPNQVRRYVHGVDAVGEEPCIANGVSLLFRRIFPAVYFDRNLGFRAPEVGNVAVDKGPTPKLEAADLSAAKHLPKALLRRTGCTSEDAGLSSLARCRFATGHREIGWRAIRLAFGISGGAALSAACRC